MSVSGSFVWPIVPAIVIAAIGLFCTDANSWCAGAFISLPISLMCGVVIARTWNKGIALALGGLLGALMVRMLGLIAGALVIRWCLEVTFTSALFALAGSLVGGMMIEAIARSRILLAGARHA
jgi:hypothetical protein